MPLDTQPILALYALSHWTGWNCRRLDDSRLGMRRFFETADPVPSLDAVNERIPCGQGSRTIQSQVLAVPQGFSDTLPNVLDYVLALPESASIRIPFVG